MYSCDYQQLLLSYNSTCFDAHEAQILNQTFTAPDLPFYPPPANAAGACSCNISRLANDLMETITDPYLTCANEVKGESGDTDNDDYVYPSADCGCCLYGAASAA